jgi:Flp pilus assembly protein TadD
MKKRALEISRCKLWVCGLARLALVACLLASIGCASTSPGSGDQTVFQNGNSAGDGSDTAVGEAPPSKQDLITAGDNAWRAGDTEKALFEYIRALELDDQDKNIYFKIGLVHEYRGNYVLSEVAYSQCIQLDEGYIPAHERKGTVLLRQRRHSEAKQSFVRAIELDKQRIQNQFAEMDMVEEAAADANNALISSNSGGTQDIVEVDMRSPFYAYNGLGVIEDIEGDHHQALVAFHRARSIQPDSAFVHNNMGYSCYMADDMEVAETLFRKAVAIDPDYKVAWRNLALVHVRRGDYEEAISILASKVENESAAYNTVGYLCMLEGNYKTAEVFFNKAIALSPTYFKAANENLKKNRQLYSAGTH